MDGVDNLVDEINKLLPSLVKEIPPDQLIDSPFGCLSLLHILVKSPDIDYQILFSPSKEPIDCNIIGYDKETPLHHACYYGNEKAAKLLLDHGAQVNPLNPDVISPVVKLTIFAMTDSKVKILKLLIEHGANLNIEWREKISPVYIRSESIISGCVWHLCLSSLEVLCTESERRSASLFLKELLNGGANVNFVNDQGENALHIVCLREDMNLAKVLLEGGCNYGLVNNYGKLPIDKIYFSQVKKSFSEMIELVHCR